MGRYSLRIGSIELFRAGYDDAVVRMNGHYLNILLLRVHNGPPRVEESLARVKSSLIAYSGESAWEALKKRK